MAHRIDTDGAVSGLFSDGNPATGTLGTKVDDDWCNMVQEEICGVIEGTGGTLVKGTNTQLLAACVAAATANKIVRRDASGRAQVADPSAAADIATKKYVDDFGWHRVVASGDSSCSSDTTPVDVTGLSFAAESGKKYLVRAVLFVYAAAASTGLGVSAKSTGAPASTTHFFNHHHWNESGVLVQTGYEGFVDSPAVTTGTSSTVATYPNEDRFGGYFVTTGAGTFQLRLRSEVNASAVTVKAGSYLEWCEVP